MAALVADLSAKSGDFRRLWAAHEVREYSHRVMRMRHPVIGELDRGVTRALRPGFVMAIHSGDPAPGCLFDAKGRPAKGIARRIELHYSRKVPPFKSGGRGQLICKQSNAGLKE